MKLDIPKSLVHFVQEQDVSTQNDLKFIATQVLNRTIRYTEIKTEGLLPEEIKTGLLNHPTIKKTLIEILSEAKTLKEEHIKQWDQLMKERPDYKENNELYAKLDSNSLSINQQLALSSQLARELHGIFCATIVMDMLSQAPNDRIGLAAHYNEQVLNIVAGIARPQWRDKLFFTLKYPEVARKTKEMILEKSITVVPEPHQSKLRRLLKEEGAGRVIQESVELITLIPELMSPDNIKKEGLLYSLLVSISENGELAALLSQNLPVLSEAFSEKALEAFLEAALPADNTSHTERFIDFLSLKLKHPNL